MLTLSEVMHRWCLTVTVAALTFSASAQSSQRLGKASDSVRQATGTPTALGAIVGDGSFEAGTPSPVWAEASAIFGTPLCSVARCGTSSGAGPHTGDWWVWFGGIAAGDSGSVEQAVTIPSGETRLTFQLKIPLLTAGTGYVAVRIGGTEVFRASYADDQAMYATYREVMIDTTPFAGPTTLRFESVTTGSGSYFVDDVSIETTPSGPSIRASPLRVDFGTVQIGTTSPAQAVTLRNDGTAALTISSITGSGAPFAVNTTGTSLTLAPGATTEFSVTFSPTGYPTNDGTVTVTSDAATSPTILTLTGKASDNYMYSSADTPIAIPDGGTGCGAPGPPAVSTIGVIGAFAPTLDLDVVIGMTHTWVGDIDATVSNGATSVLVIDNPGTTSPTGCGNSTDNIDITLDDEGTNPVETGPFPLVGVYTPNSPLSAFDGRSANGRWTLTVTDGGSGETGILNSWALLITPETVATETGPNSTSRLTVSPNPTTTQSQVSLTVATSQDVRVALYDALGREVRVLLERSLVAGQQAHIAFRTSDLPAGVYVVRATGTDVSLTERITIVR